MLRIEKANLTQIDELLALYASAREFMVHSGNPTQWVQGYPERSLLEKDIREGNLYTLWDGNTLCGAFSLIIGEDPTYKTIYDGAWHTDAPYATLHRVASNGRGGIVAAAVDFATQKCPVLRADTHADNKPMQRALERQGFTYCGWIYTHNGTPRLAYDRIEA